MTITHACQHFFQIPVKKAVFGNNEAALYAHYLNNGIHEGRIPYQMNPFIQNYSGIVNKYIAAANEGWDQVRLAQEGIPFIYYDFYSGNPLNTIGVALIDIDEDSVPELIIGTSNNTKTRRGSRTHPVALAVYTIRAGKCSLITWLESNGKWESYEYDIMRDALGMAASYYIPYATYSLTQLSMYSTATVQVPKEKLLVSYEGNRVNIAIGYR